MTDLTDLYASRLGGGDVLRFMAVEGDYTVVV